MRAIANFDDEIAALLERVRQAGVRLTAGSIVAVDTRNLVPGLAVVHEDDWVESTAEAPGQDFDAEPLARLDVDSIILACFRIDASGGHGGHRHGKRGGRGSVRRGSR